MENNISPLPQKSNNQIIKTQPKGMDFPSAIREVIAGKKIHKLEWENKNYYGFLNVDKLSFHKPDGNNYQWIISDGDLMGDDWIII